MTTTPLTPAQEFAETGVYLARAMFSGEECDFFTAHYMELRKEPRWGDFEGADSASDDPWRRYPRMIHMHRWDEVSMKWGTDPRLDRMMTELTGQSPIFVQTMLYYKAAGARGQALHQDNSYLRAKPGTCLAAWLALDDCDEENGCLQVVRGTQDLPLLCTVAADTKQSFSDVTVELPEGMKSEPVIMKRGDVLFFNGSVIHGSFPNVTKDRFRRALIGHYISGASTEVADFYHPAYRMDGTLIELEKSPMGSRCGIWVDQDGNPVVEMIDIADQTARHE